MKAIRLTIKIIAGLLAIVLVALLFLYLGLIFTHGQTPWQPNYEKVDLSPYIFKEERTDEEYELIYRQTGLTRIAVDELIATNRQLRINNIQRDFFGNYEVQSEVFAPFVCWENTAEQITHALLKDGDVIVSDSTHFSLFRFGHSALVVDGERNKVLEAVGFGSQSEICSANDDVFTRASFIILRPKDRELGKRAADYAKANLVGIDYRFAVGVLSKKLEEQTSGTHCSHIIWRAYAELGLDIDSTGGAIVTPRDIARSNLFDVVQVFGFDLDALW